MSLFNDPIYDYWQGNINYIWSIRAVNISDDLLNILDQRARKLLLICQQLNNNPNTPIAADRFDFVPASYNDIAVIAYIFTNYTNINIQMLDREIIYLP